MSNERFPHMAGTTVTAKNFINYSDPLCCFPFQGAHSYLHITNTLWPELSIWNFMYAIFCYQHFFNQLTQPLKHHCKLEYKNVNQFKDRVRTDRLREAINICCEQNGQPVNWVMLMSFTKQELLSLIHI